MTAGDQWGELWYAEVPHSGTGSASTLGPDAPRLYQRTSIGFMVDAPDESPLISTETM